MVLWVTRTQYCLLTLYWQKLHPGLQEVGTARGMRDERSYWPQTWHRENILVFASINKLPLHCTCNTKVIESNMFALKRTYLYSLLFKMHVWTTLQIVFAISYLGAKQEEAMYLEDGLGLSPPLLHQTVTDWASGEWSVSDVTWQLPPSHHPRPVKPAMTHSLGQYLTNRHSI